MSIQTKEYKNKDGVIELSHYAVVWSPTLKKNIWSESFETEIEAEKEEERMRDKIREGKLSCGKMKFDKVIPEYLVDAKGRLSNDTLQVYKGYIKNNILPIFGDSMTHKITSAQIAIFKNGLSQDYAAGTVNKILSILSGIFKYAKNTLKIISDNPVSSVNRMKIPKTRRTTWDEQTINYFLSLKSVQENDYFDMFLLTFSTGMRPGECCGIRESLLVGNMLYLEQGISKFGNITELKTDDSQRALGIPQFLVDRLHRRIQKKREQKLYYGDLYVENDLLFTTAHGTKINPGMLGRAFRMAVKRHNETMESIINEKGSLPYPHMILPVMRLYDIRHSFATNLLMKDNVPDKIISEIMGSSPETLKKTYAQYKTRMGAEVISSYSAKLVNDTAQLPSISI